jgi:hypothetical protein
MSRTARRVLTHAEAPKFLGLDNSTECTVAALLRQAKAIADANAGSDADAPIDAIASIHEAALRCRPASLDGFIGHLLLILDCNAVLGGAGDDLTDEARSARHALIEQSLVWLLQLIEEKTGLTGSEVNGAFLASGTELDKSLKH